MKASLATGIAFDFSFLVSDQKTVPRLFPESPEFQLMPKVFATGYLVGLLEWACIAAINPHIDWPAEQSVGIAIDVSHTAATPPGLTVRIRGKVVKVAGRKITFFIEAEDGIDKICQGYHERFVIDAQKFNEKAAAKASLAASLKSPRCVESLEPIKRHLK
ncbi:MAG: thioesterase family protein [Syntrophobacteraceae bacterium]|nr:thioesterase family protein [Syntrophobacteraceae bacterium]